MVDRESTSSRYIQLKLGIEEETRVKRTEVELCKCGASEVVMLQRPAEAMARAAGSAFRLFAGTDSLNVGLTASHTATLDPNDPQV